MGLNVTALFLILFSVIVIVLGIVKMHEFRAHGETHHQGRG
jgi:hypothetical protein